MLNNFEATWWFSGKEPTCSAEDAGSIPGSEDPLEKEKATHSSILAWKITNSKEREIGGYLGHGEISGYLGQEKIVVIMDGKFSSWYSSILNVLWVLFRRAHHRHH